MDFVVEQSQVMRLGWRKSPGYGTCITSGTRIDLCDAGQDIAFTPSTAVHLEVVSQRTRQLLVSNGAFVWCAQVQIIRLIILLLAAHKACVPARARNDKHYGSFAEAFGRLFNPPCIGVLKLRIRLTSSSTDSITEASPVRSAHRVSSCS